MNTVTQVAEAMQEVLGKTANRLGRETGFVKRERALTGAGFVQTLVFGGLGNARASLSELSQAAANVGVSVRRQSLHERFTESAARFLQAVLEEVIRVVLEGQQTRIAALAVFRSVYVLDSSVLRLPDELANLWPGCNPGQAGLKLSVLWEMKRGGLHQINLTAGRVHDQQAWQGMPASVKSALLLLDLGYYNLKKLAQWGQDGLFWLIRYKVGTVLYTLDGERLDLLACLQQQQETVCEVAVLLGARTRIPVRLLIERLPDEVVKQRRQTLRAGERRHQRQASPLRRTLVCWNLYVTNAPADCLPLSTAFVLAGYRWQIELLFKLWKSHGLVDQWQSSNPWRILCEVYARLIAQVIQHWLALTADCHHPGRSLTQASCTIRRKAWHIAATLSDFTALCHAIASLQACLLSGCHIGNSRLRPRSHQRFLALEGLT